jgi:hypothetical protein
MQPVTMVIVQLNLHIERSCVQQDIILYGEIAAVAHVQLCLNALYPGRPDISLAFAAYFC